MSCKAWDVFHKNAVSACWKFCSNLAWCSIMLWLSCSVVFNSLWPHGLKHTRLPCPSLSPRVCPNLWPLSQWCHPTISPSVIPFSSCLQSFPASGSFPMSQLFTWDSQSIGAPASVLPMNYSGLISFRISWFDLLAVQGTLKTLFQHHGSEASILRCSAFFMAQLSYLYMTIGKTIALSIQMFVGKVICFLICCLVWS